MEQHLNSGRIHNVAIVSQVNANGHSSVTPVLHDPEYLPSALTGQLLHAKNTERWGQGTTMSILISLVSAS